MFILVRGTRSVELLEMIEDGMKIASWLATKASDDEFTKSTLLRTDSVRCQFNVTSRITEFYYCFKSCIYLVRLSYQKALLLRSDGEVTAYGRNLYGQGKIPVLEKDVCYMQVDEVVCRC